MPCEPGLCWLILLLGPSHTVLFCEVWFCFVLFERERESMCQAGRGRRRGRKRKFFFKDFFTYLFREREGDGGGRGRETLKQAPRAAQSPTQGLIPGP